LDIPSLGVPSFGKKKKHTTILFIIISSQFDLILSPKRTQNIY
jgi:hypothetical protein